MCPIVREQTDQLFTQDYLKRTDGREDAGARLGLQGADEGLMTRLPFHLIAFIVSWPQPGGAGRGGERDSHRFISIIKRNRYGRQRSARPPVLHRGDGERTQCPPHRFRLHAHVSEAIFSRRIIVFRAAAP